MDNSEQEIGPLLNELEDGDLNNLALHLNSPRANESIQTPLGAKISPQQRKNFIKWVKETGNIQKTIIYLRDVLSEREGMIEAKPPELFQNILWILKYGKNHWKIIVLAVIILVVIGLLKIVPFNKKSADIKQTATRNDNIQAATSGDNSPIVGGNYVAGNKVSYNTYINYYKNEGRVGDIVSDATILTFFYKYASVFNQIIREVPKQSNVDLPDFLKMPYNMNVVISECRGVGFEYTIPSNNPKITLTHTTAPIEKYFFTKYTDRTNFPKSMEFIKISAKDIMLINFRFVGSDQVFWVIENADLQLIDIEIKYSKEDDDPKNIGYLWIFGSNSTEYWSQLDPAQLANKNAIRLIETYRLKQSAETSYNLYRSRK